MPGPNGDTQEDDGLLLGMVFDAESIRSSLVVSTAMFSSRQMSCSLCSSVHSICTLLGSPGEEPRQAIGGVSHIKQHCRRLLCKQ